MLTPKTKKDIDFLNKFIDLMISHPNVDFEKINFSLTEYNNIKLIRLDLDPYNIWVPS
jgi:hypothetical protein